MFQGWWSNQRLKAATIATFNSGGTGCLHGLLHPRNGHEVLLGHPDPTLLPSVANGERLSCILTARVLGCHLGAVLGGMLVGKGAMHLGRKKHTPQYIPSEGIQFFR